MSRVKRLRWLTAGIVIACFLGCRFLFWWLCVPLGAVCLLLGRNLAKEKRCRWFVLGTGGILLWIGIFSLFCVLPAQLHWNRTEQYTAMVTDYPETISWGTRLTVRIQDRVLPFSAELTTTESCGDVKPGDKVTFTAELHSPGKTYPSAYHTSAARGIFASGTVKDSITIESAEYIPLRYLPKAAGKRLREQIDRLFDEEEGALLMALLTGEQSELPDTLLDQLSRTGLRHVIAVSGLHVGFLMALLLFLPGDRRVRSLLAAAMLVFFCLLTGARPSVVRATVMGLAALLGPFFRRDSDVWASLRTALFLLLICNPYSIESVSLQLSFASVCGILLFSQQVNQWLLNRHKEKRRKGIREKLRRFVCGSISLTLGALAFTLPLSAYYFDTIPLLAPLANLLVVWVVEILFAGGLLATLLSFLCMPLAAVTAALTKGFFAYFIHMTRFLSYLPFCAVSAHVPLYAFWLVVLYGLLLLLLFRPKLRKRNKLFLGGLAALLTLVIVLNRSMLTGGGLSVQAVDVGQGQSVLFMSGSEAVAVDCGGSDAGNALADCMADGGESQLELLVLTHFDSDHVNGIAQLMERVNVEVIAFPDWEDGNRDTVERLAEEFDTELWAVTEDSTFSFGTAEMTIFAPVGEESDNNTGLSALVEENGFRALVTGDMDMETEELLLEKEELPIVDVLVVGHHGSRYSTGEAFLEAIQPKTAMISAGRYNTYGHPTEETLERLKAAGCTILRTDLQGTVTAHN